MRLAALCYRRQNEGAVDDTELVRLTRDGDLAALARLLNRHRPRLLAIGRDIFGDAEAAAEVAQETALVAVTELDRLREPAYAGAWLAGIARNLCRRRLRSRTTRSGRGSRSTEGGCQRDVIDPAPTPEEIVVRDEVVASVAGAVGLLPSSQRAAVRLFYLDELSYREVAATLGIDVNAVKARLHRARRSLQPLVAALSPHPPSIRPEPMMTTAERIDLRVRDVRRRRVEGDEQQVGRRTTCRHPGIQGRRHGADLGRTVRGHRARAAPDRYVDTTAPDVRHDGQPRLRRPSQLLSAASSGEPGRPVRLSSSEPARAPRRRAGSPRAGSTRPS